MKITAFNSSPRGAQGNTYVMVDSFLAGAKAAGAETEQVLLVEKNIKPCRGCFACWTKTPGRCVIKDDMAVLLEKVVASDIIVYATPLYVFNVSGLMKNFMDRKVVLVNPHFNLDESGVCRHLKQANQIPKYVIISNCGFPDQIHFNVLHEFFKVYAYQSNGKILAEIYRGEGELLTNAPAILQPVIQHYQKLLEEAGSQIVKNSQLTPELITELNQPLIPYDMYIQEANKQFDEKLQISRVRS
jgi:multimeric flavodoxin WrbA